VGVAAGFIVEHLELEVLAVAVMEAQIMELPTQAVVVVVEIQLVP
jgi:hypothetical protein